MHINLGALTAGSIEPPQIKKALPMAFVLEYCGIPLEEGDGRLVALCPFHPDHTPSFDVYQWVEHERFGCWACGIGGDVLDLIQAFWAELSFPKAKEAALNLIAELKRQDWSGPTIRPRRAWDPTAAQALLARATDQGVDEFVSNKGYSFSAQWLNAAFGVRRVGNEILVPFWAAERALVALKHRPVTGGRPMSMAGSQLSGNFYGEWLPWPSGAQGVLLCEGESDTWEAQYHHGKNWIVRGLPSGAASSTSGAARLAGNYVMTAFDGDQAGHDATVRWHEALQAAGCTVASWDIPDGRDLASLYSRMVN